MGARSGSDPPDGTLAAIAATGCGYDAALRFGLFERHDGREHHPRTTAELVCSPPKLSRAFFLSQRGAMDTTTAPDLAMKPLRKSMPRCSGCPRSS